MLKLLDIFGRNVGSLPCFGALQNNLTNTVWKTVFQATWNGLQKKIQQISDNLIKHKQLFGFILQLMQFKDITDQSQRLQNLQVTQTKEFMNQSQRLQHLQLLIEEEFGKLQAFRTQAQDEFNRRKREDNFTRRREVHKWLDAVDNGTRHIDILKKSYRGTGEWLLKIPQFEKWYKPRPFAMDQWKTWSRCVS